MPTHDPGFVSLIRSDPGFVSPIRSDPGFVSPIRSDPGFVSPIRSDLIRSDPGFVNGPPPHVIHHEYNLAISRSVRGRNSGVDRVRNGKTNHDRRVINRFVKKMCLTRRNVRMTCWIVFTRNTANSSRLSPEEWNEKRSISAL